MDVHRATQRDSKLLSVWPRLGLEVYFRTVVQIDGTSGEKENERNGRLTGFMVSARDSTRQLMSRGGHDRRQRAAATCPDGGRCQVGSTSVNTCVVLRYVYPSFTLCLSR